MNKQEQSENTETLKANEKKWGRTLMEAGWIALPSVIMERQDALGLDALDINILLHLQIYWWNAENTPHPSKNKMAAALGVAPRTSQRRITRLENTGFITREPQYDTSGGQKSNRYRFDGLIKHATEFAQEKLELRRQQKAERTAQKTRRGKAKLTGIPSTKKV